VILTGKEATAIKRERYCRSQRKQAQIESEKQQLETGQPYDEEGGDSGKESRGVIQREDCKERQNRKKGGEPVKAF
jgi:hypothetical protein